MDLLLLSRLSAFVDNNRDHMDDPRGLMRRARAVADNGKIALDNLTAVFAADEVLVPEYLSFASAGRR